MITFISGAPGTGKSAAVVSMLEDLGKGRQLFVHGIPDLTIPHEVLEDPTEWHNVVPDGSVIIVDEAQNFLRPQGPGQKIPEYIAKHETHRHRGLDIYYISQGPNLIHANVRALIGRHVHLRDLGVLGRWWYEWPECADNCRTAWKNAPIKKRYSLPKRIFSKYKSSSLHVKPVRSFPWMLVVFVVALVALALLVWRVYVIIMEKQAPAKPATPAVVAPGAFPAATTGHAPGQAQRELSANGKPLIDDRVDWIPRISSKPETAPAFDHLREVKSMPVVMGGVCFKGHCTCFTQQGTPVIMSEDDCRAVIKSPQFNPYIAPPAAVQASFQRLPEPVPSADAAPRGPSVSVIGSSWNQERIGRSFSGAAGGFSVSERGK